MAAAPDVQGTPWNPQQDVSYSQGQDSGLAQGQDAADPYARVGYPNTGTFNPYLAQSMGGLPQQQMAEGGVVTRPTVARLGEQGPEAVIKICPSHMSYQRKKE
jgi:hypothetical protein